MKTTFAGLEALRWSLNDRKMALNSLKHEQLKMINTTSETFEKIQKSFDVRIVELNRALITVDERLAEVRITPVEIGIDLEHITRPID